LTKKIGTLGPIGSYSEKATKQWDKEAVIVYYNTIPDAVEALLRGEVDYCVVPIENSLEGSITITLDLQKECTPVAVVVGEIIVHIKHCFLFKGSVEDVKMIYSHEQALAQCRKYIRENFPNVEVYKDTSTANAAKKASMAKHIAAIASEEAAKEYGLEIFAKNIQDVNENYTRFIVIGKTSAIPTGNDKTSIIVCPKINKSGVLYEILGEFAKRGINLAKVESRPTKKTLGEYLFYIDPKGHIEDLIIKEALEAVIKRGDKLIILGSYPVAKT